MFAVKKQSLPKEALLATYAVQPGHYTDCFAIALAEPVSFEAYVEAFYTTWLFKMERVLLSSFAKRPSTDQEAGELAKGNRNTFAAWTVESRTDNELLMCDMSGRTRSWFRIESEIKGNTKLLFGSAVIPIESETHQEPELGFLFSALLGFHKLYSRALLSATASRLKA